MTKQKLDVNTLEVNSFAPQEKAVTGPVPVMTGTSGYCNTCNTWCNWTV